MEKIKIDLMNTIGRDLYSFNMDNKYITIEKKCEDNEDVFKVTSFGINWSAIGTSTVEQTEQFINGLQEAVKKVESLNTMLKIYRENEDEQNKTT